MINQIFDDLTVIELAHDGNKADRKWRCKCKCGKIVDILERSLLRGRTKSCGCRKKNIHRGIVSYKK